MASLDDNSTHITGLNGVLENGTVEPTEENNGLVGLPGSGQVFYNTQKNHVEIHTGSSSWVKRAFTTTSTSTS